MAANLSHSFENCYAALIGLAENYRTASPPNIRLCIHCLQSVFALKPPPIIEARTHLQLGNILLAHTNNDDFARQHIEKAVCIKCDELVIILVNSCYRYCPLVTTSSSRLCENVVS